MMNQTRKLSLSIVGGLRSITFYWISVWNQLDYVDESIPSIRIGFRARSRRRSLSRITNNLLHHRRASALIRVVAHCPQVLTRGRERKIPISYQLISLSPQRVTDHTNSSLRACPKLNEQREKREIFHIISLGLCHPRMSCAAITQCSASRFPETTLPESKSKVKSWHESSWACFLRMPSVHQSPAATRSTSANALLTRLVKN